MNIQEQQAGATSIALLTSYLIVTMGGRLFALDAGAVQRVLTREELGQSEYPVIQGVIYRTIDLIARLACVPGGDGSLAQVVLLADQGMHGSVRVARVDGCIKLQQAQVLPLPQLFRGMERSWYRGMILVKHSVALVLSTTWVLQGTTGYGTSVAQSGHSAPVHSIAEIASSEGRSC